MEISDNQRKIQHLLWRGGFGPSLKQVSEFTIIEQTIGRLFSDAEEYQAIEELSNSEYSPADYMMLSKEEKQKLRQEMRKQVRIINSKWLNQMFDDKNALRDKMAMFWHNHLACRCDIGYFAQLYVNDLRKHALSNYGDLLKAISRTPAMMAFLDTNKNRKDRPNENFARELMELFTLGRGNYTEGDIQEAARAFTGYSFNLQGIFELRPFQHDEGMKTIFGKTGNFNGDDVIDMILSNKQTSHYLTKKIYRQFVNDVIDEERVEQLAKSFYDSDYDIGKLMKDIFTSDWFYEEKNIGVQIKSPIELVTGLVRIFRLNDIPPGVLFVLQRVLGQEVLSPPNVAGWAGGKSWIDNSTLMARLNLANLLLMGTEMKLSPKESFDMEDMFEMLPEGKGKFKDYIPEPDWKSLEALISDEDLQKSFSFIRELLLQTKEIAVSFSEITSGVSITESPTQSMALRLMNLPEYQMC